ncbi:lysophospholipid acyltransferase family protein [Sorangium sp. So ce429]
MSRELISPDALWNALAPLRAFFSPRYYGLHHVDPARPTLFVANHTLYGTFDVLLAAGIFKHTGVLPRGMFTKVYAHVPLWRDFLNYLGCVEATREQLRALLEAGESPCVTPGGVREVAKRKGEQYQLFWGNRLGFVQLAVEYGYPLTPVAIMGPEHAYTILWDANDIMSSPPFKLMQRLGILERLGVGGKTPLSDVPIPPLARGLGPTLLPRPERCYISVCDPIETLSYRGREGDKEAMLELRGRVQSAIERELRQLEKKRSDDQDKGTLRKLLTRFG